MAKRYGGLRPSKSEVRPIQGLSVAPLASVTKLSIQSRGGTRTRVRSLGGWRSTTELRPLVVSDCTQEVIFRTAFVSDSASTLARIKISNPGRAGAQSSMCRAFG